MANVLLVLCVVASFLDGYLAVNCDVNEQWTVCPAPCAEYCPTSESSIKEEALCETPEVCPEDGCRCIFNHRRLGRDNGTCIPTEQCPPVVCSGPNEYFEPCPPYCPTDDCSSATPDGQCNQLVFLRIVQTCSPRCRCVKGYWRKSGVCVPYRQC